MARLVLSILVMVFVQVSLARVSGRSLLGPVEWDRVTCNMNGSDLSIKWDRSFLLNISGFKSLVENADLVVNVSGEKKDAVLFREARDWTLSEKIVESNCRVVFSDMIAAPLSFKVSVECKNLYPIDPKDGGVTDLVIDAPSDRIVCQ